MIPAPFDYHAPKTLDEAIALLGRLGDTAKILAGGQSLIPAMRFRLAAPEVLVDIGRIRDLSYVEERGGHLAIGAMTREHALEASPVVAASYPLLLDTAKVIADPLVRNKATVGGNLAHADPANDHPATMLAYGAEVVARGAVGHAHHRDRRPVRRPVRDQPQARRDPHRDPDPEAGQVQRRRLPQDRAQGRRLRGRRGRGPARARRRRDQGASGSA